MTNPVVDLVGNRTGPDRAGLPAVGEGGLYTWELADWVAEALDGRAARVRRSGARLVLERYELVDRTEAFRGIHPPESMAAPGGGPPPAGLRRAAADAARPGDAQAGPRADDTGHRATRADGELRRRDSWTGCRSADRRPAAGDRRDRRRPGRAPPDAPPAAGRRGLGQDRGRGVAAARRRAGRPPGRADGADRGAGRAALPRHPRPAGRVEVPDEGTRCSGAAACGSSC